MKLGQVVELSSAQVLCGNDLLDAEVSRAFSADLMSDVLALGDSDVLLITGLVNNQVIRTAEMADIRYILFVRNKLVSEDILEMARQSGLCLIQSSRSMFRVSGELYNAGLAPVF